MHIQKQLLAPSSTTTHGCIGVLPLSSNCSSPKTPPSNSPLPLYAPLAHCHISQFSGGRSRNFAGKHTMAPIISTILPSSSLYRNQQITAAAMKDSRLQATHLHQHSALRHARTHACTHARTHVRTNAPAHACTHLSKKALRCPLFSLHRQSLLSGIFSVI